MLLEINRLQKHYGGVHALNDVSLSLQPGTVLGLLGDNGAGKSTLLKCITGSELPDTGEIIFDGHPLVQGQPHISRQAGIEMIYQDLNLCAQQSVVSNIFLGRELHIKVVGVKFPLLDLAAMKKEVLMLMQSLNVDIDISKPAGLLSGGQQQAVAIARAMLFKPKLLIMDEPTASLGVRETAKVISLIRSLKEQQISIILVSHRLSDVYEVAERIVLMRHGSIHEDRPIGEVSIAELTQKIMAP